MICLGFTEAMHALDTGAVLWCVPKGYRGWWVALNTGSLYEHGPRWNATSGYEWTRCKKGVSTMLGADFYERDGAPQFARAHYESESFLAYERALNAVTDEPNRKINEYITALNNVTHAANVERQATDVEIVKALNDIRTELAEIKRNTSHGQEPAG